MRIISRRAAPLTELAVSVDDPDTTPAVPSDAGTRTAVTRAAVIRGAVVLAAFIALLAAAYFVPLPAVGVIRGWSDSLGPWFSVTFFVAYAVIPMSPIPRTPLTLAAGVLFEPAVAFTGVTVSSTIAAVGAFGLARRLGRHRVQRFLTHPTIAAIEYRLTHRGWLAVGSLRLIAVCPFSVVNYLSGLSSVRLLPFTLATVIGMTPGNASLIFLGDALAGAKSPVSLIFSGVLFSLGVVGLVIDSRMPIHPRRSSANP